MKATVVSVRCADGTGIPVGRRYEQTIPCFLESEVQQNQYFANVLCTKTQSTLTASSWGATRKVALEAVSAFLALGIEAGRGGGPVPAVFCGLLDSVQRLVW